MILIHFLISVFLPFQTGNAQIAPKEFKKVLEKNTEIQVVDVRTLREYESGYLENAIHIDFYQEDFKESLLKLDKNKPIAVYCAVGGRSKSAAELLRKEGFKEVYDLKGGIFEWSRKGYKIIR